MIFQDISSVLLPCNKDNLKNIQAKLPDKSSMIKRKESNGTTIFLNPKTRNIYFERKDDNIFPLDIPIQVDFELTQKCNLKCKHCFVTNKSCPYSEKTFEAIKKLCERGVMVFELIGGEPFLVKDIFKIIRYLKDNNKRVSISTNGTLITKEIANKLKQNPPHKVFVSLDGPKKINDSIRGKGNFEKAVKGIKNLNEVGIIPSISFCINKLNLNSLQNLLEELKNVKIKNFFLILGEPTGGNNPFNKHFFKHSERKEIVEKIKSFNIPLKCKMHFEPKDIDALYYGCFFRLTICEITPLGDVLSCPIIRNKEGNVLKEDLADIWQRMQKKLQKNRSEKCNKCKFKSKCFPCEFDKF